jgi:hypothetical protein
MRIQDLEITQAGNGVAVAYDNTPMVVELGSGIPLHNRWRWSFDGSLRLVASAEEQGQDLLGDYTALVLTYADEEAPGAAAAAPTPMAPPCWRRRRPSATCMVRPEDSFFHTTFNLPSCAWLTGSRYPGLYLGTGGGGEGVGIGGHFPDAAVASDLHSLPAQLQRADFSPTTEVHQDW